MRRFARRLLAAAVGLVALAGLPYAGYLALASLFDLDARVDGREPAEWPPVSVVVPTYNEAAIIETKLADLLALDYPMDRVEIVLADASDDGTVQVARDFLGARADSDRPTPTLTVRRDERRGVARAVNDAVGVAGGDVILRTDADSKLHPAVLREAATTLADPAVGVVTGRQTEVLGGSAVEADYRDLLSLVQRVETWVDSTFVVHGPCTAFRRADYVPVPADTVADDTAFAVAIRRAGKRVVMNPAMAFTESGTSDFGGRRTRKDRRAMGLLQALHRNRDALFAHGAYGWVVLPMNWWFMVVSPWLFALGAAAATLVVALVAGPVALAVPLSAVALVVLGGRDALGPLQAPYAVVDSMVSLLVAAIRLRIESGDGTWTVDRASRAAFESDAGADR